MNITEIANRIANLHYPDIPKTRGDTMFRRQRVLELKKLVESELKNCSIPDVVGRSEQLPKHCQEIFDMNKGCPKGTACRYPNCYNV